MQPYCEPCKDEQGKLEIVIHLDVVSAIALQWLLQREARITNEPYGRLEEEADKTIRETRNRQIKKILKPLTYVLDTRNTIPLRNNGISNGGFSESNLV